MSDVWPYLAAIVPTILVATLFYFLIKTMMEGDRRERLAQAQFEAQEARRSGRAPGAPRDPAGPAGDAAAAPVSRPADEPLSDSPKDLRKDTEKDPSDDRPPDSAVDPQSPRATGGTARSEDSGQSGENP